MASPASVQGSIFVIILNMQGIALLRFMEHQHSTVDNFLDFFSSKPCYTQELPARRTRMHKVVELVLTPARQHGAQPFSVMSVEVVFRVLTGRALEGEAQGTSGPIDISKKLSLVGSIPELGAWSLERRVPVILREDLGERNPLHKVKPRADLAI